MSTSNSSEPPKGEENVSKSPEKVLYGGRFELETKLTGDLFGDLYSALDKKSGRRVCIRLINMDIITDEQALLKLRQNLKVASTLAHRNVVASYGMGKGPDGKTFLSMEFIQGERLEGLLSRRNSAGKHFSLKGVYNIVANVANAIIYIHRKAHHGILSPRTILVSRSGRIRVGDVGYGDVIPYFKPDVYASENEVLFWAPEMKKLGGSATKASDIYSLGALLYYLVSGKAYRTGSPPVTQVNPGTPPEIESIILKSLDKDPSKRFQSVEEFKNALKDVISDKRMSLPAPPDGEVIDDDISIDVEIDLPPEIPLTQDAAKPQVSSSLKGAQVMTDIDSMSKEMAQSQPPGARIDVSTTSIDMDKIMSTVSSDNIERWMVQKDKLDHGPFTDRELIQQILLGEVLGKHQLLNTDNGVRKKVKDYSEFKKYLDRYLVRKKELEEQAAMERAEKVEKRTNWTQYTVALIIVVVIGAAIGIYLYSRKHREDKVYSTEELAAMFEKGEISLKMSAGILKDKRSGRRGRKGSKRGRSGASGSGGGGALTYEEAMNQAVDLGNLAQSASQAQLTPDMITRIMHTNQRRFFPCIIKELNRNKSLKEVKMNFVISGSGKVVGTTVHKASPSLQQCMASKMRGVKFPSFGSPRMGATFSFYVGN